MRSILRIGLAAADLMFVFWLVRFCARSLTAQVRDIRKMLKPEKQKPQHQDNHLDEWLSKIGAPVAIPHMVLVPEGEIWKPCYGSLEPRRIVDTTSSINNKTVADIKRHWDHWTRESPPNPVPTGTLADSSKVPILTNFSISTTNYGRDGKYDCHFTWFLDTTIVDRVEGAHINLTTRESVAIDARMLGAHIDNLSIDCSYEGAFRAIGHFGRTSKWVKYALPAQKIN